MHSEEFCTGDRFGFDKVSPLAKSLTNEPFVDAAILSAVERMEFLKAESGDVIAGTVDERNHDCFLME